MRVGFVTGEYPPMQGGIGDVTRRLALTMAAQGHMVYVFTREQAAGAGKPNVEVSAHVSRTWGWSTNASIKDWAAQKQLDVVNVQFQTAAFNMHPAIHWLPDSIRTVPVVVTFHDLRVPYLFPKAGLVREWVVKRLAGGADGVITTNHEDENTLQQWQIERVCRVPIGSSIPDILPAGYNRPARRAALGIGPDDLLIGTFGFLNHTKGGLVLLDALRRLIEQGTPAHLVMIGGRQGASDPTNAHTAAQIDAVIDQYHLADCVHSTGFLDNPQVSACFHDSDLVVLPFLDGASLRRSSLMVALAHGRAIITTTPQVNIPELAQAVEAIPTGDAKTLTATILQLWQDPGRRKRLEQAAALAAHHFEWDSIASRTIDFYKTLDM